ncbi:hypothetical protein BASA50_000071 [Batrachochytrium salamandrivorans]|uniref:Ribosomal protein L22 n=1 Tax=Batrachochytrium salamandrivorans TaxID=1357716 RepID=A0ABQ8EV25_9FUNG|nr:hypothetical protein BASA62_007029 [Batrachochytrium salamandrivorans]KAH6583233.1 hypothetical protein BASA60_001552 [Batrachochytrium salamandrivorans]KAH6587024.1 hypothetical protein BASA50_000071 [Batrachochytrium salamandrivorans]KAH6601252.1 hypothetical protein BASA61_002022 [Batrachochytrium salamandrivorans]KAH9271565.1 hypothetical protein BASA83_006173 [Batrachochytrium salamandrivorans]
MIASQGSRAVLYARLALRARAPLSLSAIPIVAIANGSFTSRLFSTNKAKPTTTSKKPVESAEMSEYESADSSEYEPVQVPPLHNNSKAPQVYGRIKQILARTMDATVGLKSTSDHIEALKRAQKALRQNTFPKIDEDGQVMTSRPNFLKRLSADGGDKILRLQYSFVHVEYTRFIELCSNLKGLSLNDALLQLAWHQRPITKRMMEAIEACIVHAKEEGYDLNRTYICDILSKENAAILSDGLKKKFLRGRGRYGSTPHIKSALLKFVLQERDRPFQTRLDDPLEWIRVRLRKRYAEFTPNAEAVYARCRTERPVKPVHV